jgi:hypothetical protein
MTKSGNAPHHQHFFLITLQPFQCLCQFFLKQHFVETYLGEHFFGVFKHMSMVFEFVALKYNGVLLNPNFFGESLPYLTVEKLIEYKSIR